MIYINKYLKKNEYKNNSKIFHYIGTEMEIKYRRHFLNDALKEKYNIDTGYRGLENKQSIDYDKYDLFVISEYIDNNKLGFELDKIKCKIIYDRSDYWNYLDNNRNHECENELLKRADLVINSSKFLYEDSLKYNKNCLLIEFNSKVRLFAFFTQPSPSKKPLI